MEHKTLPIDGLLIHYTVEGHGPDVVFVHGWSASRRMWGAVTAELAKHYRCWSLDLPGCGDSDKPVDLWYTIPNFTTMLRGFMLAHGLERARLVGHSMGGMISLNLAARHPELIQQLVAINPVVTGNTHLKRLAHPGTRRKVLQWLLQISPHVLEPLLSTGSALRVNGVHHIRRRTEDFFKVPPGALWSSGRAIVTYDLTLHLPRIAAPTLVLTCRDDQSTPAAMGEAIAAAIPGAKHVQWTLAHIPFVEAPDRYVELLGAFLEDGGAGRG